MFYVLAGIVVANLALVTFLIVKLLSAGSSRTDALVALAAMQTRAERAEYELAATTKTLDAEHRRSLALEAYADEIAQSPNADLAPDDVAGRLRRLFAPGATEAAGDSLPAVGDGTVLADPAAAGVHDPGPDDLQRPE